LWKSDGSESGTVLVRNLAGGASNTLFINLCANGSEVLFNADNGTYGYELWKSDGSEGGTGLVRDIRSGASNGLSSLGAFLTAYNGQVYLSADNGSTGREPWVSDGTQAGTRLFKSLNAGGNSSSPYGFTPVSGALFFVANDATSGAELWKTDGTPENTAMVKNIQPGSSTSDGPSYLTAMGGVLYFAADNSSSLDNRELWRSDGTAAGTYLVKEINPATDAPGLDTDSIELEFTNVNDELLFFVADDGTHGIELWVTDGTADGTHMVKEIIPPAAGPTASPYGLRAVGSRLFFGVPDGVHGSELWVSDGTEAGTHIVKDINTGAGDGYLGHNGSIAAGNTLYFRATDGSSGEELWKSDGTEAGTVRVADLAAGASSSNPTYFSLIGDSLYFYASGDADWGLWKLHVPGGAATTTTTAPGSSTTTTAASDTTTTTVGAGCVDDDGDGYGTGADCLGPDCDDEDPQVWDNCTTCTVKQLPRRLSKLLSYLRPVRFFLFRAADGMQFDSETPILWPDEALETIFQVPLGKKKLFLLALVRVRAPLLEVTEAYEVRVGGCTGTLKIKIL
jgi:ELWxxDGT repeat protein